MTCIFIGLISTHTDGINGPWYWKWPWRRLPALRVYGLMLLASVPVILSVLSFGRKSIPVWLSIALLMIGSSAVRFTAAIVTTEPMSIALIHKGVVSPGIGSYWTSAAALVHQEHLLSVYPEAMEHLAFHAVNKPPGPVMYHLWMIRAFGYSDRTAILCGFGLGILATLSIPMMYYFARVIGAEKDAAFQGAAFLALCPGFLLFFPMTDPVYPIFTCALSIFWFNAIKEDSPKWSILFSLGLSIATFITYNFLVIGVFFAGMIWLITDRDFKRATVIGIKHSCIVAAVFIAAHILFFLFTRYDPIATFQTAYRIQNELIAHSPRSRIFPMTIPWDLHDFFLGAGWIAGLIALYRLARRDFKTVSEKVILLGVAQIILTACTGLLQTETARVWNFLFPLLMLPVGIELAKWNRASAAIVLICLLLIAASLQRNMTFLQ